MKLSDFDDDDTPTGVDALKDLQRRLEGLDHVINTLRLKISKILERKLTDDSGRPILKYVHHREPNDKIYTRLGIFYSNQTYSVGGLKGISPEYDQLIETVRKSIDKMDQLMIRRRAFKSRQEKLATAIKSPKKKY